MATDNDTTDFSEQNSSGLSRRDFAGLSVATGIATMAGGARAAVDVVETDVMVKTPDGMCDAAFIHPASGAHPGVIIWADVFGLRPSMRAMARRMAAEGFSVLVPNPYYRTSKAPQIPDASTFDFAKDRAQLTPLTGPLQAPGAAERDAVAYVAFLDSRKEVDKTKKIGTQGYCMGGPLVVKTAAAAPGRIGAGGSFHGGGLVTDKPDSPHLLAPKIKAGMYFAVAGSDDVKAPGDKDTLRKAMADAKVPAEVELYANSIHGWCVSDMPMQNGKPIYNKAEADMAWAKLVALYKKHLA